MYLELMDSDLARIIHSSQPLTESHYKCFMKQILEGVNAMHRLGIFHRDLKPGNILLTKDCHIRIADLGLARYMHHSTLMGENTDKPMTHAVVTTWYRCLELLLSPVQAPYSAAIDIWSVGCIFAELMMRKALFPGKNHLHQIQTIFDVVGYYPPEELGFPLTAEAKSYLRNKVDYFHKPWEVLIPPSFATAPALNLLEGLLTVDPHKRVTAEEALHMAYLKDAPCYYRYSDVVFPEKIDPNEFFFEEQYVPLPILHELLQEEILSCEASAYRKPLVPSPPPPASAAQSPSEFGRGETHRSPMYCQPAVGYGGFVQESYSYTAANPPADEAPRPRPSGSKEPCEMQRRLTKSLPPSERSSSSQKQSSASAQSQSAAVFHCDDGSHNNVGAAVPSTAERPVCTRSLTDDSDADGPCKARNPSDGDAQGSKAPSLASGDGGSSASHWHRKRRVPISSAKDLSRTPTPTPLDGGLQRSASDAPAENPFASQTATPLSSRRRRMTPPPQLQPLLPAEQLCAPPEAAPLESEADHRRHSISSTVSLLSNATSASASTATTTEVNPIRPSQRLHRVDLSSSSSASVASSASASSASALAAPTLSSISSRSIDQPPPGSSQQPHSSLEALQNARALLLREESLADRKPSGRPSAAAVQRPLPQPPAHSVITSQPPLPTSLAPAGPSVHAVHPTAHEAQAKRSTSFFQMFGMYRSDSFVQQQANPMSTSSRWSESSSLSQSLSQSREQFQRPAKEPHVQAHRSHPQQTAGHHHHAHHRARRTSLLLRPTSMTHFLSSLSLSSTSAAQAVPADASHRGAVHAPLPPIQRHGADAANAPSLRILTSSSSMYESAAGKVGATNGNLSCASGTVGHVSVAFSQQTTMPRVLRRASSSTSSLLSQHSGATSASAHSTSLQQIVEPAVEVDDVQATC